MKIYTKGGDRGLTGLLGPGLVSKGDRRIDAYGTVDELNATIGVARAAGPDPAADAMLAAVQDDLFVVGSALADPNPLGKFHNLVAPAMATRLEGWIDEMEEELEPLRQFILPGGSPAAASLHLSRTVCRRAEREVVKLAREGFVDQDNSPSAVTPEVIIYLNRLSDFLFVLARAVNARAGVADVPWAGA